MLPGGCFIILPGSVGSKAMSAGLVQSPYMADALCGEGGIKEPGVVPVHNRVVLAVEKEHRAAVFRDMPFKREGVPQGFPVSASFPKKAPSGALVDACFCLSLSQVADLIT